jgi:plasmid stabilization system protein ParE
MADPQRELILVIKPRAKNDLRDIWLWNAEHYSAKHADDYIDFLMRECEAMLSFPNSGGLVPGQKTWRYIPIFSPRARHGHVAVYQVKKQEFQILRFFHTAQNWQKNHS